MGGGGRGGYIDVNNTREFKVCAWVVWWVGGGGGYIDVDNTRDFKACVCIWRGGGGHNGYEGVPGLWIMHLCIWGEWGVDVHCLYVGCAYVCVRGC